MIVGIGNDIIEIKRFEKIVENKHFLEKCFTQNEISISGQKPSFYAANFSVKESVSKVFGTGVRGFELCDIEVLRDELGKPYVVLHNRAAALADKLGIDEILVTISDTDSLVMTVAVGERRDAS